MTDIRIERIYGEAGDAGPEWWIDLMPGWQHDGEHQIHEDTRTAAMARMPEVDVCRCAECSRLKGR